MNQNSYIIFFKPFGVLSQFTAKDGKPALSEYGPFPKDVYPAGRLDADSEGLLLLTNDSRVQYRLTNPEFKHSRTYLVQVERIPVESSLQKLRDGLTIEGKRTKPAQATLLEREPNLPPRSVPIRFRKNVSEAWLEITLFEGRNRQVRKMTAAIGHPTLRLVRQKIGSLSIDGLIPGQSRSLTPTEIQQLRKGVGLLSE
jgi:23S rRNA pseudouridine2457 synthase